MATLVLNVLILAGTVLLCARIYQSGLFKRYRSFFYFLVFYTLQTGLMMTLDPGSGRYQKAYVLTEPIGWVLYALVVLELYSLVLKDFQGLYTVGRWALILAVALALAGSALIIVLVPSHETQQGHLLAYYYVAERAVHFSLAIFLLSILGFMLQYPITLSRNIVLHSMVYTFYFLCSTVVYLALGALGYRVIFAVRYALLGATLAALIMWLARLNPAGEKQPVRFRPAWMPGGEQQLIDQLNSLNEALLRATRK